MAAELAIVGVDGDERRWSGEAIEARSDGEAVAVSELLEDTGPATHVSVETDDADYRASIPLDVIRHQGRIVHARDGHPLTEDTGGPYRLLVEDGSTLCWNVKHVARLRLTEGPEPDSVPEDPPH